jgi:hypothetical protein
MPAQSEWKSRVLRVLVVEDEPRIREAIAAQFERDPDFDLVGKAGSRAEARGMLDRATWRSLTSACPTASVSTSYPSSGR